MENTTEVKIPKKRGRKPKSQKLAEENIVDSSPPVKVVKKRGRKPKDKYSSSNKLVNNSSLAEVNNIILHLPINSKDMKSDFVDKEVFKYNPNLGSPEPYNNDMGIAPYHTNFISPYPNCLNPEENDDSASKNYSVKSDLSINIEPQKVDTNIETDKTEITNSFDNKKDNNENSTVDKNINDYNILSVNTKNCFDIKSNISRESEICCYWCCHTFSNKPIGLPTSYKNGKFSVIGNFCSPECACSYNYYDNTNSSANILDRYSLLNFMCSKLYNIDRINIKRASSRYALNIFGGPLTIDMFRENNINYSKDYIMLEPPLIAIVAQVNEIQVNSKVNKFIPIDSERIKNVNDELKLRRKKPTNNKMNTLENCMNLKYL